MSRPEALLLLAVWLLAPGCAGAMNRQPRYDPLEPSSLFADGASARQPVAGTVPREGIDETAPPARLTRALVERGRIHFEVNCSPCHGLAGQGDGMIVRRGFPRPPSFHEPRLRQAPDVHFWSVMTNGAGRMHPYRDRLTSDERWQVVAWIRALQLSQAFPVERLQPDERRRLEAAP